MHCPVAKLPMLFGVVPNETFPVGAVVGDVSTSVTVAVHVVVVVVDTGFGAHTTVVEVVRAASVKDVCACDADPKAVKENRTLTSCASGENSVLTMLPFRSA